ncbi:MAG: hypothetical protein EI684_08445 [Candidatus Viridilinea halotolerans]|uniref:TIGR02710 family CRISPR-associated protein n=1 Tax=Candidatus Viridilinea halotolerans TaxID=2491704 RepID=A0A426U296_9CHLR|nr:MAG: hypothetical protein EI684_08445 [Candidatus Viridilinea halotolerans]
MRVDQELKDRTEKYWDKSKPDALWYIEKLLPLEMQHMLSEGKRPDQPCHTLALLVGFSYEPLLQSIWFYRPERVVLLFNRMYGDVNGKNKRDAWQEYLQELKSQAKLEFALCTRVSDEADKDASSEWIFAQLRELLLPDQRAGRSVIIDITGAKKSMVAGAYLFAAYAGVPVSYVDFDEYDERRRRPKGYSGKIALQPNPYATFGLRDWERVQGLYRQYAFGSARKEAAQIACKMQEAKVLSAQQGQTVQRLCEAMCALEQWDNGDYAEALRLASGQAWSDLLPTAIDILGADEVAWPSSQHGSVDAFLDAYHKLTLGPSGHPEQSFYARSDLFVTYARDELAKIGRLIKHNEDFRSALLRAAGLIELLLVGRAFGLAMKQQLVRVKNQSLTQTVDVQLLEDISEKLMTGGLKDLFFDPSKGGKTKIRNGEIQITINNLPNVHKFQYTIDYDDLAKLRNKAIHTHLSIPRSFAEHALAFAKQALTEYETTWVPYFQQTLPASRHLEAPSWEELCALCGVDFLPALPQQ